MEPHVPEHPSADSAYSRLPPPLPDHLLPPTAMRPDRRWQLRGGAALVVIGLISVGAVIGWSLRGDGERAPAVVKVEVDRPVVAAAESESGATSPNVIGLDVAEARRVLSDLGIEADAITTTEVPAAGQPGVIVTVDPPAGVPILDTVALGVAVVATMPDLAGLTTSQARDQLAALGARVVIRTAYVEGAAEGVVLSTDPAPGTALGPDATVTVAAAPSSVFLVDIDPASGSCSEGEINVNGSRYPSSLNCPSSSLPSGGNIPTSRSVLYLVDRRVARVQATVGQDDRSTPGFVLRLVIKVDDVVAGEVTVGYGESKALDVVTTGALRLSFDVSAVSGPPNTSPPSLVLGSARFVGGPDEIDELTG